MIIPIIVGRKVPSACSPWRAGGQVSAEWDAGQVIDGRPEDDDQRSPGALVSVVSLSRNWAASSARELTPNFA